MAWILTFAGLVLGALALGSHGGALLGALGGFLYARLRGKMEELQAQLDNQQKTLGALRAQLQTQQAQPEALQASEHARATEEAHSTTATEPAAAVAEGTAHTPPPLTEFDLPELDLPTASLHQSNASAVTPEGPQITPSAPAAADIGVIESCTATDSHADPASELAQPLAAHTPPPSQASAYVRPDAPQPHAVPQGPTLAERAVEAAREWLFGGNTVLRVGALLLFLGLAFLLRYATEGMVVPIEMRYAGVAASAIALLGLGWWLRHRRPAYALILQGTGVGVLYLTVFAAMRLHPLLAPGMALGLLVLVTASSAVLAVMQNALGLAVAAALGGFAAPLLTSSGSGNFVALFIYLTLLNAGIIAIAVFKAWRLLNLVGFIGTFSIMGTWIGRSYTADLYANVQPFLVVYLLMFVTIGLLFARRRLIDAGSAPTDRDALLQWSLRQGDYIDATVMFGPPLIGFGLQYLIVSHIEFGTALSALALGLLYMLLARVLAARAGSRALLLTETCLSLGVIFATLAIPLALDAQWTSAAWAVEGAGIYWLGLRQHRPLARTFALLLQLGAALALIGGITFGTDSLLAGSALGALMVGGALLTNYALVRRSNPDQLSEAERDLQPWFAIMGLSFLYMVAPLLFAAEGTAITWGLAGLVTLSLGLRQQLKILIWAALAIQLLGGWLFLGHQHLGGEYGELASGWHGMVVSTLLGAMMLGGAVLALRNPDVRGDSNLYRALTATLLAALVLLNLAVLFVLPWRLAAAAWAVSGLAILWLSLQLEMRASFFFGLALQVVAGASFVAFGAPGPFFLYSEDLRPLAHSGLWTPLTLALAALAGAWQLHRRHAKDAEEALQRILQEALLIVWGVAWWSYALVGETLRFVPPSHQPATLLLAAAGSALLAGTLAVRLHWHMMSMITLLLLPAGMALVMRDLHPLYHPGADFGWLGWLTLFCVHFLMLRKLDTQLPSALRSASHVLGAWLLLTVLSLELRYALMSLSEHYNAWRWLGWAALPSIWLLAAARGRRLPWPVSAYPREYRVLVSAPLAALLLGWFWVANSFSDGTAAPLPYLPLLNPLEVALLFVLFAIATWLPLAAQERRWPDAEVNLALRVGAGISLFALATAAVFRAAHHLGGIPFELPGLLASMQVQASLSLVWTSIALGLMVFGHRRGHRELWLTGAALIAVVVAKLFFVELGNRGGLERIISFIGVGVLLLVVGYFSPLPPRTAVTQEPRP